VMQEQLHDHFKTLSYANQFGFRQGHSMDHAVLENTE
jgi:hypothetical protein